MAGNIAKVGPITEGEDLTHAKSRKAAMDRAKIELTDAAEEANGNVVSAVPELKGVSPVAMVVVLTEKRFSSASEQLD